LGGHKRRKGIVERGEGWKGKQREAEEELIRGIYRD